MQGKEGQVAEVYSKWERGVRRSAWGLIHGGLPDEREAEGERTEEQRLFVLGLG